MFGKLLHPTLELSLVLIVISVLFVAESSVILDVSRKGDTHKIEHGTGRWKFALGTLIAALVVLVYGIAFLGLHLYEKVKK